MKTILIVALIFAVYMMYRDGKRCKDILAGNTNAGGSLPPYVNPTHGRCM